MKMRFTRNEIAVLSRNPNDAGVEMLVDLVVRIVAAHGVTAMKEADGSLSLDLTGVSAPEAFRRLCSGMASVAASLVSICGALRPKEEEPNGAGT